MEPWKAVVLGLVEGITEFLPISSTGHLILVAALLGSGEPEAKRAEDAFLIVVQGGAVLAVLGLYWRRVQDMLRGLLGRSGTGLRLAVNLGLAFVPAALVGAAFDERIERWLFHPWPVLAALALGGVWMIWLARPGSRFATASRTLDDLDWRAALGIGLFQCLALWPGTSRSMVTIAGGVIFGLRARESAEFSFLLGVPTLGGATLYKLASHWREAAAAGEPTLFEQLGASSVLLGMAAAVLSAALAVRWLVGFLNRHGLAPFGWYRIGLAVLLGALLALGVVDMSRPSLPG